MSEVEKILEKIMGNREALCAAFIADTGLAPSECVLVTESRLGEELFWVEPKSNVYATHDCEKLRAIIGAQSDAMRKVEGLLLNMRCEMTGGQTYARAHSPSCPKCAALAACREAMGETS